MTFLPGTAIRIDGRAFVVQHVHRASPYYVQLYTVRIPRVKPTILGLTEAGVWRYGLGGKTVTVTWHCCDGCSRALLEDEKDRCDDCRKVDDAIAEGSL